MPPESLWELAVDAARVECERDVTLFGGRFVDRDGIVGALGCPRPMGTFVHAAGADLAWLLAQPDLNPPLTVTDAHPDRRLLLDRGWRVSDRLTVMILPGASSLRPVPPPVGYEIELVDIPGGIDEFHLVFERGFGAGPGMGEKWLPRQLLESDRPWLFVARQAGTAVGTAGSRLRASGASIFAVSVLPEQRGRGLGAALTAAAASTLLGAGAEFVILHATRAGHHVYERVGFQVAGPVTLYLPAG